MTTGNILAKTSLLQGADTQKARAFLSNVGGSGVHLTQREANGVLAWIPKKMTSSALESFGALHLGSTCHTGEVHNLTSVLVTETFLLCSSLGLAYLGSSLYTSYFRNPPWRLTWRLEVNLKWWGKDQYPWCVGKAETAPF